MNLTPAVKQYILHWGEMGTRWGLNRSIAQIHALLFLSPEPLPAEEISNLLSIARSNVSMSLRELQSWGLVHVTHVLGDRRDHFEAEQDVWELANVIVQERKRRELDPTLSMLRQSAEEAHKDGVTDPKSAENIQNMLELMEQFSTWYDQVRLLPKDTTVKLLNLGARVATTVNRKKSDR